MKQNRQLGVNIAGIPIQINTENLSSTFYIKSLLKNYLDSVKKPYFYVDINKAPSKMRFSQGGGIKLVHQGSHIVFVSRNKRDSNQQLGFVDKENRVCQLNISEGMIKALFYPLLMSTLSIFLSDLGGFIIHSSGIIYRDHAYIFSGPSGSGKSTIACMLKKKGLNIISEEKIIIRNKKSSFFAYTAPWLRDRNQFAPLKNILFLKKSNKVKFMNLSPSYAISRILPNIIYLNLLDHTAGQGILDILCLLFKEIPSYEMEFTLDNSFWHRLKNLN